ncbi:MAG: calcium-translocating P-type ATPase, PMCA-type [Clostridia bacterium]|jgi:P-type Ca2+ transporter type 2C|nr:calcium-translocating P-type ATPase, PMCA-type [Clostridia bacterium]
MQNTNEPYNTTPEQLTKGLGSGESGLTSQKAELLLAQSGANALVQGHKKTLFSIVLSQFKNLMIIVLLAAGIISAIFGEGISDAIIIFAVIILNAVMGTVQESKAEAALDALKKMSAPNATVMRDGEVKSIPAADLVVGDVVILEAGDFVPADLRLISTASLKIEEAALTGESVPSEKNATLTLPNDTPLAERANMTYSGTSVTYGRGTGVVTSTGMSTEIGKIAGALNAAKEGTTPLQKRMNSLSKVLSIAVLIVAAVVFGIGMLTGRELMDMFFVAISLAVAAIPEGLATVVTLQLTMGVQKMSRSGAIIRKLPAVETLGCTSVVCSDKTGTLTQNKMSVMRAYYNNEDYKAKDVKVGEELTLLGKAFILCNDTKETSEDGEAKLIGDPTETALYQFASGRLSPSDLSTELPRTYEIPFDSERKLMSTVNGRSNPMLFVKGAPDELIARCSKISLGGKARDMTEDQKEVLMEANESFAKSALRVLAAAYKPLTKVPNIPDGLEEDLVFIGLVGMMDPPREEAKLAVAECKGAGMMPVMITGDHKTTAVAIADKLGILKDGAKAITGKELDQQSDSELTAQIKNISVYARVAPEHKVRIVSAFQAQGNVVAMTGDGVNDAPALKTADIGVGMGITGTEVSKNAADMVLTDDNFATIVKAVKEGRRIYRNIKKAVQFLLSANLSEVLTLLVGTAMGFAILHPVQILWINLVTDTFPALALGMEPAPKGIMKEKPRDAKQSFFSGGMAFELLLYGTVMAALVLGIFFLALTLFESEMVATTMAFLTLGMTQLFHAFNIRSGRQSFVVGIFKNKWMPMAFVLSVALQIFVVLIPGLNGFFKVAQLSGMQWLYVMVASFAIVPICEIVKFIKSIIRKLEKESK